MVESGYYIFAYIGTMIVGVILMTLLIFLFKKNKTHLFKWMRNFSIALLLYAIFEMLLFYFVNIDTSESIISITIIFSDLSFYVFMYCWIRVMDDSYGGYRVINYKLLVIITIIYAIIAESPGYITVILGTDSPWAFTNEAAYIPFITALSVCYGLLLLYCGIRYVLRGVVLIKRGLINRLQAILDLLFSIAFSGYVIWTIWWDYQFLSKGSYSDEALLVEDPLFLIYIVFALGTISYIYRNMLFKNDKLGDSLEERGRIINNVASDFSLTDREREVSDLILQGYSNGKIADELSISEHTTKRHINNIYRKSKVKGRFEFMALKDRY